MRGLLKINARRKIALFRSTIMPLLNWVPLIDTDWQQAAYFGVNSVTAGKQISDIDLLIAALAKRLK
jgi:predicted nucleic acid-binding protein